MKELIVPTKRTRICDNCHGNGYLTKSPGFLGSITSKPADEELDFYSDRYSPKGGITYLWLYNVDVDDGSYSLVTEGTLNQVEHHF